MIFKYKMKFFDHFKQDLSFKFCLNYYEKDIANIAKEYSSESQTITLGRYFVSILYFKNEIRKHSQKIKIFLPAFLTQNYYSEDELINSIAKTIVHEYIHKILYFDYDINVQRTLKDNENHHWAIDKMGLMGV